MTMLQSCPYYKMYKPLFNSDNIVFEILHIKMVKLGEIIFQNNATFDSFYRNFFT